MWHAEQRPGLWLRSCPRALRVIGVSEPTGSGRRLSFVQWAPMRRPPALLALCLCFAACAGDDGGNGGEGGDEGDRAEAAKARAAVTRFVNNDDCDVLSTRFLEEGFPGESNPRAACRQDTLKGVRRGDYRVESVAVNGETATVRLKLNTNATRTYTVVKQGDRWLVDDLTEEAGTQRADLGEPLLFFAPLEIDGQQVDARLKVTVLSVKPSQPPEFYPSKGGPWFRARARVTSDSSGPFIVSVSDFELVDAQGQRANGNSAFEPRLGHDSVTLSPGDTVTGFVGFELPRGSKPKEVRFLPAVAPEQNPMVWTLR